MALDGAREPITLAGDSVVLRRVEPDDVAELARVRRAPEVRGRGATSTRIWKAAGRSTTRKRSVLRCSSRAVSSDALLMDVLAAAVEMGPDPAR